MRRNRTYGFGIVEALMSLFLIGIILGIVARGYQAMSRLNLATYQMSQRMELSAFLQRLSYEVTSAVKLSLVADGFTFDRVDPTLNLERDETSLRLPWPLLPGIVVADPMDPTYQVNTIYRFNATANTVERTAFSVTTTEAVSVGEFIPTLEPGGRILTISMKPKEMTSAVKAQMFLPVVKP